MSDESMIDVMTAFLVVVQKDGRVAVLVNDFPAMQLQHTANLFDIETYASQAAREAGRVLGVHASQPPAETKTSDRIAEALNRRNEED